MLNKLQCRLIIMGYRSFYDSYINTEANEEIKKAMYDECLKMRAEYSAAVKRLNELENEEV